MAAAAARPYLVAPRAAPRAAPVPEVLAVLGDDAAAVVAHLLAQALGAELRCGLVSTLGCGFPGALGGGPVNADCGGDLGDTLADLGRQGARAVVVELGPDRPWSADLARLRPTRVVLAAPPGAARILGPIREWPGVEWLPNAPHIVTVGETARSEDGQSLWIRAARVEPLTAGLRVEIESSMGSGILTVPLLGEDQGRQLLAVLAVQLSRGLPMQRALRELSRVRGVPGRMEMFGGNGAPLVVVDHARQPDALEEALTDLRRHAARRVITVVGCDGDRDRAHRPLMGAVAQRLSDALILTDDNPRGEDGTAIIADILGGLTHLDGVRVERQRGLAIRRAIALAGTGDAVLVAGKGHEHIQDMGELKVHFSDRAQVVEALREWREGHH
jgi:UDP-N-acetylmuramoyl-L-alanyl-D-glutamate--2,6-diaminopimelate ligase